MFEAGPWFFQWVKRRPFFRGELFTFRRKKGGQNLRIPKDLVACPKKGISPIILYGCFQK